MRDHALDPMELFSLMACGGVVTLGIAGWMIGRRDDALSARNRELRDLSLRLSALSATDALTGIPNRRTFDERLLVELARSLRYSIPLSLVMVDLDHFKSFNDRFGHRGGDEVLRQVGRILESEKRLGDLVARYGGEEFVAILPHTDCRAARSWAERVRMKIAMTSISFEGGALEITASFGVAEAEGTVSGPAQLIDASDAALYDAKRSGRNRVMVAGLNPEDSPAVIS